MDLLNFHLLPLVEHFWLFEKPDHELYNVNEELVPAVDGGVADADYLVSDRKQGVEVVLAPLVGRLRGSLVQRVEHEDDDVVDVHVVEASIVCVHDQ